MNISASALNSTSGPAESARCKKAPGPTTRGSSKVHYSCTKNSTTRSVPPYGRQLQAMLNWGHRPVFIPVCIGNGCWASAKRWALKDDFPPLLLPDGHDPDKYQWPVAGQLAVIEAGVGPDDEDLLRLVKALLRDQAETVTIWRSWHPRPIVKYWAKEVVCSTAE